MKERKNLKRFVALFVALTMVLSPFNAFAADSWVHAGKENNANHKTFTMGEFLDVHQTGVGANGWIGLYDYGATPGVDLSYFWIWTDLNLVNDGSNILAGDYNSSISNGYYLPQDPDKKYQLFLFRNSDYDNGSGQPYTYVTKSGSISIRDYTFKTNKSQYCVDEPINVQVDYIADFASTGTSYQRQWVGLFRKGDPYKSGWALYWYYLSDWNGSSYLGKATTDILNQRGGWTSAYGPGDYEVVLFHTSRTDSNGNYKDYAPSKVIPITIKNHATTTTTTAATCTTAGNTKVKCTKCSYEKNTPIAIVPTAHSWNDWVTDPQPTCTASGTQTRTCKYNSNHKETKSVDAVGHGNFTKVNETPKTCTTDGVKAHYKCGKCNAKFQDANGKTAATAEWLRIPKSHNLTTVAAIAPKCEKDGNIAHYKCSVCSKNFADSAGNTPLTDAQIVIPKTGHNFAYEEVDNVITETCLNGCGHKATAEIKIKPSYVYTGSEIKPLHETGGLTYGTNGTTWKSGNLDIFYLDNINVTDNAKANISKNGNLITTKTFAITEATMNSIGADDVEKVYDGNKYSITVTGAPLDANITYSTSESGPYSTDIPKFSEVSDEPYTVYYKVEKENYTTVTGSAKVIIKPADNEWITVPSIDGWTYGESVETPVYQAKFGQSTAIIEYRLADSSDAFTTEPPTAAGKYEMRVTVPETKNYRFLDGKTEFTIGKVELTITAKDYAVTYGDDHPAFDWEITGSLVGSDKLTDIEITCDYGVGNAGTYDIIVEQKDGANPNYKIDFVNGKYTIAKKEIGIKWGETVDLVYDGTSKVPAATATGLVEGDTCNLTTAAKETTAGAGIIPGNWTAEVTALDNPNYKLPADVTTPFNIINGFQALPVVTGNAETIDDKADGTIDDLTTEMEWKPAGAPDSAYQKVTDPDMTFADGEYEIRYAAKEYYDPSGSVTVTIDQGRMLTVTVPVAEEQIGYTLTTDDDELSWNGDTTIRFTLHEGYTKTEDFAVKVNGVPVTLQPDGTYEIIDAQEDKVVTVEGVADITPPTAEIQLNADKWNNFDTGVDTQYFKASQEVTITAEDLGSGLDKIYYYLATEVLTDAEAAALKSTVWTEYTGPIVIDPQADVIVYAKAVDKDGNKVIINSDRIVVDSIVPEITFDENENFYGDTTFEAKDTYLDKVYVDGEEVTLTDGKYTIDADGEEHTIKAVDKAGNETEIKVTLIPIPTIDDEIEDTTTEDVKSSDKEDVKDVLDLIEDLIESGKDYTEDEDKALEEIKEHADELIERIEAVEKEIKDVTDKVTAYDEDKVTCKDREDIESLLDRADKLLETDNLTVQERTDMEKVKDAAEGLIDLIESKDPKHHFPGEEATCTTPQNCTHCDKELVPAKGHHPVAVPEVAPKCTEDGTRAHYQCPDCGKKFEDKDAKVEVTTSLVIPQLGHDYKAEVTKEPTCTEPGERTYTCQRCGHQYTEPIPALGHHAELVPAVAPTCTEDGAKDHYQCPDCGKQFADKDATTELDSVAIPQLGHDYKSEVTKEPTAKRPGERTYTCQRCGHQYTEKIPMLPAEDAEDDSETPTTGDSNNIWMWLALLMAGSGAAVFTEKRRRRQ